MRSLRPLLLAGLCALAGSAHAIEFRSVGTAPAVLYDSPSLKATKTYIAPRGMPVEVILNYGEWTKVRDAAGDLFWLEAKALTPSRTVVVTSQGARVRVAADDGAAVLLILDKGVLLDLAEPASSGWVKVRHRDGQAGFVKANEVWGE